MTLWLSRLKLRRDAGTEALAPLLDPAGSVPQAALDPHERGRRLDAHHRLIWSLFADGHERRRDFLWRAEGTGRFVALSAREPAQSPLFEPVETRPFAPNLEAGDRLAFALRANATRTFETDTTTAGGRKRKVHRDVVMLALHDVPKEKRATHRMRLAQEEGAGWLQGQGARAGFEPAEVAIADYTVAALPGQVRRRARQPQYGILEMTGALTVTDPAAFLARLAQGFGRARAFGCGLMLIRRA
jgi:CRISPR system Cascade subunit CasE